MLIDLHMHSSASDGSLTPGDLVEHVAGHDVGVMALTDHDSIAGLEEARRAGQQAGITVLSGVELSIDCSLPGKGHLHVLGYAFDENNPGLAEALNRLQRARDTRGREIVARLRDNGVDITEEELLEQAGAGSIGRPHVAALLIQKEVVRTTGEAFYRYLSKGKPAYVPKKKLDFNSAVQVIHQAGGVAVLAHPISLGFDRYPDLGRKTDALIEQGLDGIEAFYPSHSHYFSEWLVNMARKKDLLVTGGTDFHGAAKPDIRPGRASGTFRVPEWVWDTLKERLTR